MKDADVSNLLAVLGDADARSTAMLVEMIAATALFKLAPPEGNEIATVEISQADISDAMTTFFYTASYSEDGTMTIRLSSEPIDPTLGRLPKSAEVTSG